MAEETKGVQTLMGDPCKAVIAIAIPIAIASIVQSTNNIIDAIWVSGLGTGALAATGVIFPYFFILLGIGNGIGVGASQAIARRIGAKDSTMHNVASQAFVMSLVVGLVLSIVFYIFLEPLLALTGAGEYMAECKEYGTPIVACGFIIVFCTMFSGILRAEGAAKRAMLLQVVGASLNLVLDPIFIYTFNLGIAGAAWATVLSMGLSIQIAFYWYFIKKDTYVRIPLKGFRFDAELDKDIMKIGVPASLEMILMSLCAMATNLIVLIVDPTNGIAIFTTGWRILDLLMIPAMSLGFAVVPICAAAFGAREFDRLKTAYRYSLKCSLGLSVLLMVLALVAAPLMVALFTYSDNVAHLSGDMTIFLRICCLFLPVMGLGFPSVSMFQALGKGVQSLCATLIMNLLRLPLCYVAATVFGTMTALCIGLTISEILGSIIIFGWCILMLRAVFAKYANDPVTVENTE